MGSDVASRPKTRKRIIASAVGASLLVALFVSALAFANSVGASRVADNARALHWANAAMGTSALTRAALVQATTFVELADRGLASEEDVGFVIEQAENAHRELLALEEETVGAGSPAFGLLRDFSSAAGEALAALSVGDNLEAESLIVGELDSVYGDLVETLQAEQDAIQEKISNNTASAARMNSYIVFMLTLAIPGAAVVAYWWVARRQVRELRVRARAELEAERAVSRAKDSFIAGLSHELRTPLTSIYGFAEILSEGGPEIDAYGVEAAKIIANEAAEMRRMVDDLLTASRLESTGVEIELEPTFVREVVESAISPFERAGAAVQWEPSRHVAKADPGRLRHVLVNLVSNAVRHGGPKVGVEVTSADGVVEIEVWDNGPGVPEQHLERLFDRFVHDGTQPLLVGSVGLGLAVASRLTVAMGGALSYQRFGERSFFTVRLPVHAEPEPDEDVPVSEVIKAFSA